MNVRWWSCLVLVSGGCSKVSEVTMRGDHDAQVGETAVVTATGVLRSEPGEVSLVRLEAYDGDEILGDLWIEVEVEGGKVIPAEEMSVPPAFVNGIRTSNEVAIRHERGEVTLVATAEIPCVAPGEVKGESARGLEWTYDTVLAGGVLSTNPWPFECVGDPIDPATSSSSSSSSSSSDSGTTGGSGY